jgi:hypothetical protein
MDISSDQNGSQVSILTRSVASRRDCSELHWLARSAVV